VSVLNEIKCILKLPIVSIYNSFPQFRYI
jgi:hypothetical protein